MAKRDTSDILEDLPLGDTATDQEEAADSGIPSFVQDDAQMPSDESEEVEEPAEDAQDTQVTDEEPTPEDGPPEAAAAETAEDTPEGENAAPAAQEEPEAPPEPPAAEAPEVPTHPPVPSVEVDATTPHPSTEADATHGNPDAPAASNAIKDPLTKEDEKFVAAVSVPVDHGDLVTQTEKPEPAPPRLLKPGEKLSREVAQKWDVMMVEVSSQTRMIIWEMGISSMQQLLTTPKNDLVKPRGRLAAVQVKEVEDWCIKTLNFKLPKSRQETKRAYRPPAPITVGDANVASRKMTPELVAARRAWLKGMRGDSTRK